MVHARMASAGLVFASHFFQACKLPQAFAFHGSQSLRQYVMPRSPLSVAHPWLLLSLRKHHRQPDVRFHLSTRFFGSRSGSGIPGKINIDDEQKSLANIDQNRIRATVHEIRKLIGSDAHSQSKDRYDTYDVSIYLVDDEAMREANKESRNIDEPTDILSFQFHDAKEPGVLEDPIVDIADYYNLGDIIIDVPYVIRSCEEDRKSAQGGLTSPNENSESGVSETIGEVDDDEWVDDDRGVSHAMSKVFNPEQRINMLLVHGLLHLVGYDHEKDDDYELMVTKEDEILRKLEEFGLLEVNKST